MKIVKSKTDCISKNVITKQNNNSDFDKKPNVIINNHNMPECVYGADNKPVTTIFHGF